MLALGAWAAIGAIVWAVARFGLEQADQAAGVIGSAAGLIGLAMSLWTMRSPVPPEAVGAAGGRDWVTSAAGLSGYQPPRSSTPVRGRDTELSRLDRLAKVREGGDLAVICGTGGLGKTTLAAEFARRAQRAGKAVFWVRWQEDAGLLADDLTRVAQALGLPESAVADAHNGRAVLVDTVWGHLAATRGWVVVVDNVDTPGRVGPGGEPLANYRGWLRPDGGGLLLVTSRDTSAATWGAQAHRIALEPLTEEDAGTVLLGHAPAAGTPEEAQALGARVGGLPLALDAVGHYLAQPTSRHRTFASYRNALEAEFEDLLGAPHPRASDPEIARTFVRHTWELSLIQLENEGYPLSRPLLHLLALLELAPIPRSLITPALLSEATGTPASAAEVDTALAGLHRYALLRAGNSGSDLDGTAIAYVALQPLVRDVMALSSGSTDGTTALAALDNRLLQAAQEAAQDSETGRAMALHLGPHMLPVLNRSADFSASYAIVSGLADAMDASGHFVEERPLREHLLNATHNALGPDDPNTLASRNNLAYTLTSLGRHQEAADLLRSVLTETERILSPNHPYTLTTRSNLASTAIALGHYQEAVDLLQTVLTDSERIVGPNHPITLTIRNNLAAALDHLGNHQAAVDLLRSILIDSERIHGPDHSETLASRSNLATTLGALGQHQEAAFLLLTALIDSEHIHGPNHLNTLTIRSNFATELNNLGQHQQAAELHRATLTVFESIHGADHPDTLTIRSNLATALGALGQHQKAATLLRTALTDSERIVGPNHPMTINIRENLAIAEANAAAQRPPRLRGWPRRR
ncbi:FxSxx-COOH system tetratricopeptide repeat protein [Streptomyces albidoflavus]